MSPYGARIDRYTGADGFFYERIIPKFGGLCPDIQGEVRGREAFWQRIGRIRWAHASYRAHPPSVLCFTQKALPLGPTDMNDSAVITFKTKLQNGRVPLPSRLRTLAGVSDGDPISITLIKGHFVVTPARRSTSAKPSRRQQRETVMSHLRAQAPASLKAMWADSRRHGTDKMTTRQINALIAEVRAEQAVKHKVKQPAK